MKSKIALFLLLFQFSIVASFAQSMKVVGYLPSYRFYASSQIEYQKLTHLNVCFANPDTAGNLIMPSISSVINDAKADNPNIKICISLAGGWLTPEQVTNWTNLIDVPANRPGFVNKIVNYILANNLDGVDVDLEWDRVTTGYSPFVLALKAALQPHGKIMTAALPNDVLFANITNEAINSFDFINVMSYDKTGDWAPQNPGQHSPYDFAVQGVNFWKNTVGLPASKVVLGVPFYGFKFIDSTTANAVTYAQMVALNPANADVDVVDGNTFYNGRPTIQNKVALAKSQAGGIMIWELGQDSFSQYSLLSTIHTAINSNPVNAAPSVVITAPTGYNYTSGSNLAVTANATDTDGTINKVEFYINNSLLATVTTAPYTYNWINVPAGGYDITAKAFDNLGATTTSAAKGILVLSSAPIPTSCSQLAAWNSTTTYCGGDRVTYNGDMFESKWCGSGNMPQNPDPNFQWYFLGNCPSINQAPSVSITAPTGYNYTSGSNLAVTANATDTDGTINKVEFYINNSLLATVTTAPYTYNWINVPAGGYDITAKAFDNLGATTTSAAKGILVLSSAPIPTSCSQLSTWNSTTTYCGGDRVTYNGDMFESKWCGSGNMPQNPDPNFQWYFLGNCPVTNTLPVVNMTSPACGTSFNFGTSITINATANDTDGSISKIEFFDGTTKIGEDTTLPYSFTWTNGVVGSHSISCKAIDNVGGVVTTNTCTITINSTTVNCASLALWNKTARYNVGNKVKYNSKAYECIASTRGNVPSASPTKWVYLYDCAVAKFGFDTDEFAEIVLFPNPTNEEFNLNFLNPKMNYQIEIFDVNGRCVYKDEIKNTIDYNFGNQLESGVYFLHVNNSNNSKIIKIVKN